MKFLHAKSHKQTENFTYIGWGELCNQIADPRKFKNPLNINHCKAHSAVIAAHDAQNKTKEAAEAHDNFTLLRLDLDGTKDSMEAITELLESMGIESFIIHTTANHTPESNRFRVYIELAHPLPLSIWQKVESYLSYVFRADDCATRSQQIMYLPFFGSHYAFHIAEGEPLDLEKSDLLDKSDDWAKIQIKKKELANSKPIKPKAPEKLIGHQVSIIDLFNDGYDWDYLLRAYGYKQQGVAWLPPESTSKAAGAYILSSYDGKDRYFSHHDNDPCAVGKAIDKFDFVCIREYSGKAREAINDIAKQYFPEVHKHNFEEWKTAEHNKKVIQALNAFNDVSGGK